MKHKLLMTLALLCAVAQWAWAWDGSGTATDPYQISSSADWQQLANDVGGGNSYSGKYFKLKNSFTTTVSVGAEGKPFSGTFDGGGNALSYHAGSNMTPQSGYCAPFVQLNGATIRNLIVKGAVFSSGANTAGIASLVDGTTSTTIEGCRVEAIYDLLGNGFGGFVGKVLDTCTATLTFSNCSFFGQINTNNGTNSAGFVGYSPANVSFTHCMVDHAGSTITDNNNTTFAHVKDGATLTIEDCAHTRPFGTAQGTCVFREVKLPEGFTYEIMGTPNHTYGNRDYWNSGTSVFIEGPAADGFNHWDTGTGGCFVSDPKTQNGIHRLRDIYKIPELSISTTGEAAPVTEDRVIDGTKYRYLCRNNYHLYLSDEDLAEKRYHFSDDGELFFWDAKGNHIWVTAVVGWDGSKIPSDGAQIHNDLKTDWKEHTLLGVIAPHAFDGCTELKTLYFKDTDANNYGAATSFDFIIGEKAFANCPNLTEIKMMQYTTTGSNHWEALKPTQLTNVASNVFDGSPNAKFSVDATEYQNYIGSSTWKDHRRNIIIYNHTFSDDGFDDYGAKYIHMYNTSGDPLKNNDEGNSALMQQIKLWNGDYQQFNAATLITNSDENIWYTQVYGTNDDYLNKEGVNGVMRIYNDPGEYYNYRNIAIKSLGESKAVKAIEFYQTMGRSSNSYTEPKMVIQNGAFKNCTNLKELRMFYYVQDGNDRWIALGPKDIVPGDNIFGVTDCDLQDVLDIEQNKKTLENGPTIPKDFKILVSPDLYPEYLDDPNWLPYLAYIEPVDYSPSTKKDITKDGLTYGFMTNPGGIMQTSQTVSQDVSWWTVPRIAIEVVLWAYSIYRLATIPTAGAVLDAQIARVEASNTAEMWTTALNDAVAQQTTLKTTSAAISKQATSIVLPEIEGAALSEAERTAVSNALLKLNGQTVRSLFITNKNAVNLLTQLKFLTGQEFTVTSELLAQKSDQVLLSLCKTFKTILKNAVTEQAKEVAAKKVSQKAAEKVFIAAMKKSESTLFYHTYGKLIGKLTGTAATAATTAGLISSLCWGGNGSYSGDLMQKGLRANIISNMHQVSLVGGGYVITTPSKNIIYHTYIKNVSDSEPNAVIYAGFDDDNNSYTSDRTMTFGKNAFRNHKNLKTVSFHAMEGQSSNAALPLLLTIPDSAFVGCDNLVELNLLLKDNEKGTRPLGPENFILAGDSIFAGLDPAKFHIVIDPSRKQDFLDNESWAPLEKYFTYQEAVAGSKYNVYGGQYAYAYENNSIKREHKVSGHLIEHTEVIGADNSFLDAHQGALKLCNDIGRFDNFQIDAVHQKAFKGNDHLRVVNFTDLYGAGAFGDSYTGLEMELGDSCFTNCKNLANIDMLYLVTDGTNHIDPIKPEWVKVGRGILDGTNAIIKMLPEQKEWFMADSSWVAYKDRFATCIIRPADDGIKAALKPMAYYDMANTDNDWATWDDYIDLARIGGAGFSWLDGKFREKKDDIRSFADFKYFDSVGLDYVGREWFRGCRKMTNITLPSTIKTIEDYAFASCSSLQEIEIPEKVEKIKECAFADCSDMKTIVVRNTVPAELGSNAFNKNEGMKIYVPAESLNNYLTAWAEYKDYIVGDDTYKVNKVITVKTAGTLADELGLSVEWSYSGGYAGDEPRYLHGNYSKYDSLTVSGPLNNLDLWVIRYLAGSNGYNRGGVATEGCLRYLNLYNASIKKDESCKAHYLNSSIFIVDGWREIDNDNQLPMQVFRGCTALESVILPKTLTSIKSGIFEGCTNLKHLAMTGALKEYDGYGYKLFHMLDYPLEELVFLTDGHATSDAKDPWGQDIGAAFTSQERLSDYLNDPCLVNRTEHVAAPFEDDDVWNKMVAAGEFFPAVLLEKEDVGRIFSEMGKSKTLKTFDEFQNFINVKRLDMTFAFDEALERVSIPASVEHIAASAFHYCTNLKTITMTGTKVPELEADAFNELPSDFVIYVPRDVVKLYRTEWAQYADHINPKDTYAGTDKILTVTLTEPNTLAEKLGLKATWKTGVHINEKYEFLYGVSGDYSKITKLKVIGPISGGDLNLLRYLAGFCSWSNTRNFAGHLEYIDLYDAELKSTRYGVAPDVGATTRDYWVYEDNVLPAYSFLQAYNLRTLILPRTLKEVRSRALQQCESMETLVLGDDLTEFNWNALDDDASMTRMYILAKNKVKISNEFPIWRWLCNNYNPTFDAFYVRPSLYENYLNDDDYTGSSWQRTNNVSKGEFEDDDAFSAFASHAAATADELAGISSVKGWFDNHKGIKDLTPLQYTAIDTLSKATLAPLTKLEKVALPITLESMEEGLFANAKNLRYVDMLFCDSTNIVSKMHNGGFKRLGINTQQTLVYLPKTYGKSDGTNIVSIDGGRLYAKAFNMVDTLDYMVPYAFETDSVKNTRSMPISEIPYTVCLPYKMKIPAYCRAYVPSDRDGNRVVFKEIVGELEAMKPYLLKVVGNKRLRKTSAKLETDISQTIPASSGQTIGGTTDAPGYSVRGTFATIDNKTAAELGAYTLHKDGDWYAVTADDNPETQEKIPAFRVYMLQSSHSNARGKISMTLEDVYEMNEFGETTGIESITTVDTDGTENYYDLNGRKLSGKPDKGIYIHNGKKLMSK